MELDLVLSEPEAMLDEEDLEELLTDCHDFIREMRYRALPKRLAAVVKDLDDRLTEISGLATRH